MSDTIAEAMDEKIDGLAGLSDAELEGLLPLMMAAAKFMLARDYSPEGFVTYTGNHWANEEHPGLDSIYYEVRNAPGCKKLGRTGAKALAELALDRIGPWGVEEQRIKDRALQLYRAYRNDPQAPMPNFSDERQWRRVAKLFNNMAEAHILEFKGLQEENREHKSLNADAYMLTAGGKQLFLDSSAREALGRAHFYGPYHNTSTLTGPITEPVRIWAVNELTIEDLDDAAIQERIALEPRAPTPAGGSKAYDPGQVCMVCGKRPTSKQPLVQMNDARLGDDYGDVFHSACWEYWLAKQAMSDSLRPYQNNLPMTAETWVKVIAAADRALKA